MRIGVVRRWQIEAHVSGKNKEELSHQAIYPNPARLPGLFLAGEAFSAHQGWTEGALQTAEDCAKMILSGESDKSALRESRDLVHHPNHLHNDRQRSSLPRP